MNSIKEMYDTFQITDEEKKTFQQQSAAYSDRTNDAKAYTIKTVIIGQPDETMDSEEAFHA